MKEGFVYFLFSLFSALLYWHFAANMEQYGNTETFNIENVIVQNVKTSLYYVKYAVDLDTPYDLIDEIFEKCVKAPCSVLRPFCC